MTHVLQLSPQILCFTAYPSNCAHFLTFSSKISFPHQILKTQKPAKMLSRIELHCSALSMWQILIYLFESCRGQSSLLPCAYRYLAVGKMGGEANRWLCCWETWVALHLTAAWQLPTLQKALSSGPWKWARNFTYHACLSFIFPLAIAALPFEGCAYQLLRCRSTLSSLFLR